MTSRFAKALRDADAVIVGSCVPQGVQTIAVAAIRSGRPLFFYDIDTPVTLAKLANSDEEYLAAARFRCSTPISPSPAGRCSTAWKPNPYPQRRPLYHTGVVQARELAARIAPDRQSRTAAERIDGRLTESAA
jgi:hypothetical protein